MRLLALCLFLATCSPSVAWCAEAVHDTPVQQTQRRFVASKTGGISRLEVDGKVHVKVVVGEKEGLLVEGKKRDIETVQLEQKGGLLAVRQEPPPTAHEEARSTSRSYYKRQSLPTWGEEKVCVTVYVKEKLLLNSLALNGEAFLLLKEGSASFGRKFEVALRGSSCCVVEDCIATEQLLLQGRGSSCVGKLHLHVKGKMEVQLRGTASLQGGDGRVKRLEGELSGGAALHDLHLQKGTVDLLLSGKSKLQLRLDSGKLTLLVKGQSKAALGGSIQAKDLVRKGQGKIFWEG